MTLQGQVAQSVDHKGASLRRGEEGTRQAKKKPRKAFASRGINLATTYFPGRSQYHRPLRA